MSNVVNINTKPFVMSTREFAEKTGRQHGNVMTTVRGMIARGELNVPETQYANSRNVMYPEFKLSLRDYEKMAYRLEESDLQVIRKHFGVREMKIEPAPEEAANAPVMLEVVKAPAKASTPATLNPVRPIGAIGYMPEVVTMSSKEIAALTEKRHGDVLRDIRVLMDAIGDVAELQHVVNVPDSRGYTAEMLLPRDITETLITGYSVPLRLKVIRRLHELEAQAAKPAPVANLNDPAALRGLLLGYTEQVLQLEHKLEEAAPAINLYAAIGVSQDAQPLISVAKVFNTGQNRLFRYLRKHNILMTGGDKQNLPYQQYQDAGRFEVTYHEYKVPETGEVKLKHRTFLTPKGLDFLHKFIEENGRDGL